MHWVYIIKSTSRDITYIGETNNLEDRLLRHNQDRNKFTKGKGPWQLVVSYLTVDKSEACKLERKLKNFKNSEKAIKYLVKLNGSV